MSKYSRRASSATPEEKEGPDIMHPEFGRFMVFFMAASLGLAYGVASMVGRGLIDPTPARVMYLGFVSFGLVLLNSATLLIYMTDLIRDALKEKKTNGKY